MNVMKEAHAMARRMIANNVEGPYRDLLASALRVKHAAYKKQARITLEVELNSLQLEARHQNNTLQAWLFANANAIREGREPSTSASAIAYQTGLVQKANARIVELTLQLASM